MKYGEQAVRDVEDFWAHFRELPQVSRTEEIGKLQALRNRLANASAGPDQPECDSYVMDKIIDLMEVCRRLARLRQSSCFSRCVEEANGIGDVQLIRTSMAHLGLADEQREA